MRPLATFVALILFVSVASAQSVEPKDLDALEGATWIGTLTYLDYGSGKKTLIKSNLNVVKKSDGVWAFEYIYPEEPKANGISEVTLAGNGKSINGQAVTTTGRSDDGRLMIVATKEGDDNSKKAVFRYTYSISSKDFSIRKEVQYIGETAWFERNTYSWIR